MERAKEKPVCSICGESPNGYYIETTHGACICMACAQCIAHMVNDINENMTQNQSITPIGDDIMPPKVNKDARAICEEQMKANREEYGSESFWLPIRDEVIGGCNIDTREIIRLLDRVIPGKADLKKVAGEIFVKRYEFTKVKFSGELCLKRLREVLERDSALHRLDKDIATEIIKILDLGWL